MLSAIFNPCVYINNDSAALQSFVPTLLSPIIHGDCRQAWVYYETADEDNVMKHSLAKINHWLPGTRMLGLLLLAGLAGSAHASNWGPWSGSGPWNNDGRNWNWHSPKNDDFFSWGTGQSDNPWDKWGPWNKRKEYPWESNRWDKMPWSGNRPWDRGGFDMPWSKKKARRERRKDYLEYLQDSRKQRLQRKLRYSRPPYPPPYGYGYGYPPAGYPPPPARRAPAPSVGTAPVQPAQGKPAAGPRTAPEQSSGAQGVTQ